MLQFGKVYKGLWRGTVVAVKSVVLPANMSGAEKRERMAIMEAAISSSLSHPNIVQVGRCPHDILTAVSLLIPTRLLSSSNVGCLSSPHRLASSTQQGRQF